MYSGERLSKSAGVFHVLGLLDVVQVHIGMIATGVFPDSLFEDELRGIQRTLVHVSSCIATTPGSRRQVQDVEESAITLLEQAIDRMTQRLPPLTKFILVGTSFHNALVHQCRTSTRTVERALYDTTSGNITPLVSQYINRLSDYFFTLARYHTYLFDETEIIA